jgi:predicted ChrR family anti-sigma factor
MTRHDRLDDAARDHAVAYALDGLSSAEASEFEAHLESCEACSNEVQSLRVLLGELGTLAPPQAPPPDLKNRLMAKIRESKTEQASKQPWKSWTTSAAAAGLTLVRAEEGGWEPTGVDGVVVRRLFLDVENDRATMLVRMAPGTSYPAHVHAGAEECFVLEGDLLVGESRMRAGDYQRATSGSLHGMQSTEGGCLLFIVSSLHDEMLPGREAHR